MCPAFLWCEADSPLLLRLLAFAAVDVLQPTLIAQRRAVRCRSAVPSLEGEGRPVGRMSDEIASIK